MYFYFAQFCREFIFKEKFLAQIWKTKPIFENIGWIPFYNGLLEKVEKKKGEDWKKETKKQINQQGKKEEK